MIFASLKDAKNKQMDRMKVQDSIQSQVKGAEET